MHVGPTFVADEEPLEVVEVREGALDDPADASEPGAVLGLAASDDRRDPEPAKLVAVAVGVVAAISDHALRPAAWTSDRASDCWHGLHERQQLLDVVAVGAGQAPGKRDPTGVDEEVLLRPRAASVDRARARLGAPFFAWIWLESTTARDHSSSPAARRR